MATPTNTPDEFRKEYTQILDAGQKTNYLVDPTSNCRYQQGVMHEMHCWSHRLFDNLRIRDDDSPQDVFLRTMAALSEADGRRFLITNIMEDLKHGRKLSQICNAYSEIGLVDIKPKDPSEVAREYHNDVKESLAGIAAEKGEPPEGFMEKIGRMMTKPFSIVRRLLSCLSAAIAELIRAAILALHELIKETQLEIRPVIGGSFTGPTLSFDFDLYQAINQQLVDDIIHAIAGVKPTS